MKNWSPPGVYICLLVLLIIIISCNKVDITFGESATSTDPNLTYIDNYKTDITSFKVDSFETSNDKVFCFGYHYDSLFGVVKAGSFSEINLPVTNPVLNQTLPVVFDSLNLIIIPTGRFYGDSSRPVKLNVYRLTQNIVSSDQSAFFYNTTSYNYNPVPLGQQVVNLYGRSGSNISVKLSDALGQELLTKFINNDLDITSQDYFSNYFKGIYINTDSTVTNTIGYFNSGSDSVLIRLSYHLNGVYQIPGSIDFTYNQAKQFNNVSFRNTNPNLSAFISNKTQEIPSNLTGNQAYFNSDIGCRIKISFPTLLNLKELHPLVSIVKAVLVIKPDPVSYLFPYQLPKTLYLYSVDPENNLISGITYPGVSQGLETGDLVTDYLYNQNTYYSYDITGFINSKIAEGQASTSSLLLYPTLTQFDEGIQRFIVNDQTRNNGIQLKLYVLGL